MSGERQANGPNKTKHVITVLLGMAVALGVFIALYVIDFVLADLAWCVPALALAGFLIFSGSRKLRNM